MSAMMNVGGRTFGGGLGGKVLAKQWSKYNEFEGATLLLWIGDMTGEEVPTDGNADAFRKTLKDGRLLCRLVNALRPGSIKKVMPGEQPFAHMANIDSFLTACRLHFDLPSEQLFRTLDLTEARDLFSVTGTLRALGKKAQAMGRPSPEAVDKEKIRATE